MSGPDCDNVSDNRDTNQEKSWVPIVGVSIIVFLMIVQLGAALVSLNNDTNVEIVFFVAISIAISVLLINFPGVLSFRKISLPVAMTAIAAGAFLPALILLAPHHNSDYLVNFTSKDLTHRIIYMIFSCVLFPVTEEIYFRGLLFPISASRIGYGIAAVMSVTLFALYHMQSAHLIGLALQGIIYTWLMYRTRSVYACILGHSVIIYLFRHFLSQEVIEPVYRRAGLLWLFEPASL